MHLCVLSDRQTCSLVLAMSISLSTPTAAKGPCLALGAQLYIEFW
jgi:hypothetical protein